jgi:hypothetical protein
MVKWVGNNGLNREYVADVKCSFVKGIILPINIPHSLFSLHTLLYSYSVHQPAGYSNSKNNFSMQNIPRSHRTHFKAGTVKWSIAKSSIHHFIKMFNEIFYSKLKQFYPSWGHSHTQSSNKLTLKIVPAIKLKAELCKGKTCIWQREREGGSYATQQKEIGLLTAQLNWREKVRSFVVCSFFLLYSLQHWLLHKFSKGKVETEQKVLLHFPFPSLSLLRFSIS